MSSNKISALSLLSFISKTSASKNNINSAEDAVKKMFSEISVYSNEAKKNNQHQKCDQLWNNIKKKSESLDASVELFIDQIPKPSVSSTKNTIPLERLPLPKFSGKTTEYNQWKINFLKHVKYDTEDERVLALKQRCMVTSEDREAGDSRVISWLC